MTATDHLLSVLRTDPVLQASFEAERHADMPLQLSLLDAVLTDDHREVQRLLAEEDHGPLLPDSFFLNLAIVLVCQASPQVVSAFAQHGYDAMTKFGTYSSGQSFELGTVVLALCSPDRQQELIDAGFMKPADWIAPGMKDARPEVFDFWCGHYAQKAAHQISFNRRLTHSPEPSQELFWWMPPVSRSAKTPPRPGVRLEMARRLEKMIDVFLSSHYPATDELSRWNQMLAKPFEVSHHLSEFQAVERCKVIFDYQLARTPNAHEITVAPLDLTSKFRCRWASALLECGLTLSHFEDDLPTRVLKTAAAALRKDPCEIPPALDHLWALVLPRLAIEDPSRLAGFPAEVSASNARLRLLPLDRSAAARMAFADLLDMSAATPGAPAVAAKGLRL